MSEAKEELKWAVRELNYWLYNDPNPDPTLYRCIITVVRQMEKILLWTEG
ncbi:hypothetical protein SAMN05661008_01498 [Alkalithermobacter thermoalcaliphilus JW-YL-7 = DSM 7308]|uniref:Uncharacterized protein n=2 Tax=Clostridium paradoxum TaxID=29346 RepID=A0A150FR23_CLOPD|nr:hypothetical protein JWYL7_1117 [[Clostridium] paradoxum JW-YL-7 = DSM 7308]SHL12599.1 hypothetical protein SAMN05661008_01498 [[Clostridium] paradoxum JW-YL-7 = DSM 7308]